MRVVSIQPILEEINQLIECLPFSDSDGYLIRQYSFDELTICAGIEF